MATDNFARLLAASKVGLEENGKISPDVLPSYVDDVEDLLVCSSEAPTEFKEGDKYYNTEDKLIYTATSDSTWDDGETPVAGKIYINTSLNPARSLRWDGEDLVEIGSDLSNYLAKDNTEAFTPTGDYNPSTKKYVDDVAETKQDVLTAGNNITIDANNVIDGPKYYIYDLRQSKQEQLDVINAWMQELRQYGPDNWPTRDLGLYMFDYGSGGAQNRYLFKMLGNPTITNGTLTLFPEIPTYPDGIAVRSTNVRVQNGIAVEITGGLDSSGMSGLVKYNGYSSRENLKNISALSVTNDTEYTPTTGYNPATKKYVDDSIKGIDYSKVAQEFIDEGFDYLEDSGIEVVLEDVTNFELQQEGYYESVSDIPYNGYAYAKLAINNTTEENLTLSINYLSSAYALYNYGLFSQLDVDLTRSNVDDGASGSAKVLVNCKGSTTTDYKEGDINYTIPTGEHFVVVKYRKQLNNSSGNNSLRFSYKLGLNTTKHLITKEYSDNKYPYIITYSGAVSDLFSNKILLAEKLNEAIDAGVNTIIIRPEKGSYRNGTSSFISVDSVVGGQSGEVGRRWFNFVEFGLDTTKTFNRKQIAPMTYQIFYNDPDANGHITIDRVIASKMAHDSQFQDHAILLAANNNQAFTPTGDYNLATKKYVDDSTNPLIFRYDVMPAASVDNLGEIIQYTGNTINLPDEYQPVTYVKSSGTQYINTGIDASTIGRIVTNFKTGTIKQYNWAMGANNHVQSSGSDCLGIGLSGAENKNGLLRGSQNNKIAYSFSNDTIYEIDYKISPTFIEGTINGAYYKVNNGGTVGAQDLYLYGLNYAGQVKTGELTAISFGRVEIYGVDQITLLGDFIPCYKKDNLVAGFYDTVSETFLTADGLIAEHEDLNYVSGYFYKCVSDGGDPATYSWELIEFAAPLTYAEESDINDIFGSQSSAVVFSTSLAGLTTLDGTETGDIPGDSGFDKIINALDGLTTLEG